MTKPEFIILGAITFGGVLGYIPGFIYLTLISMFLFAVFGIYKGICIKEWTAILISLGFGLFCIGRIFKQMHWPWANGMFILSLIMVFGIIGAAYKVISQESDTFQKLLFVIASTGLILVPIHLSIALFSNLPRQIGNTIFATYPYLILLPTFFLLLIDPKLFKQKSIYPILLIIACSHFLAVASWLRRFIETMIN